ncbi:hypothetical protein KDL01_11665 [Actinospica durhamensis]|uniref:Uncharacterized protein n=1 Tax=Actinospica durhamensis TaxID=1508375 RepID=A0A941EP27_9ACTN|nr:hypothetical protein [Actinospica durhamensis]MBR7833928.1 hypothetical protein [Actinospica durhamensis]
MQALTSLTPVRTFTVAASLALTAVFAAAPLASAAIGDPSLNTPRVLDNGRTLSLPFDVSADEVGNTAMAQDLAASLVGGWAGQLIGYAAANAQQEPATCHATVTANDSDGARGTGSVDVPAGATMETVAIADEARDTRWGVGDVDHFTLKFACTDVHRNSKLSEVEVEQAAIAGS